MPPLARPADGSGTHVTGGVSSSIVSASMQYGRPGDLASWAIRPVPTRPSACRACGRTRWHDGVFPLLARLAG
jgi:hypothetical protein